MFDAIKPLLDSDLITEETRMEINEAWEAKLVEARNKPVQNSAKSLHNAMSMTKQ